MEEEFYDESTTDAWSWRYSDYSSDSSDSCAPPPVTSGQSGWRVRSGWGVAWSSVWRHSWRCGRKARFVLRRVSGLLLRGGRDHVIAVCCCNCSCGCCCRCTGLCVDCLRGSGGLFDDHLYFTCFTVTFTCVIGPDWNNKNKYHVIQCTISDTDLHNNTLNSLWNTTCAVWSSTFYIIPSSCEMLLSLQKSPLNCECGCHHLFLLFHLQVLLLLPCWSRCHTATVVGNGRGNGHVVVQLVTLIQQLQDRGLELSQLVTELLGSKG